MFTDFFGAKRYFQRISAKMRYFYLFWLRFRIDCYSVSADACAVAAFLEAPSKWLENSQPQNV